MRSMLNALTDVTEEHNGSIKFARNGETLTVHPPRHKNFSDVQDLMQIRHFLERSAVPEQAAIAEGTHLLVVIDHREARIYRTELHGTVPERIVPYDPDNSHRHLHNVDDDANGQRQHELKPFYDAIARSLSGAEKILIFGSATGASSAMDYLLAELKQHHHELAERVIGTVVVNEQHMTEDQLLAKAREFYNSTPTHVKNAET
ncbi:hypothetical protein V2H45_24180 [Tumidithrix elongata RA019]|uniref:Uncharacterized protein n=1 Tax=Tumidithrix elongata BACA0141 TaxID=2716417 RepID=A0AAW9Q9G4_9CYAN|nr:hypothetical protein [Tumidithrix elongata RA019]